MKAGRVRRHADAADVHVDVREVLRREPRDRVRTHRVERDVAEVEQAGVADDDVQAEGHHGEDHHRHARVDAREVAEDDHVEQVRLVERIEHREQDHAERDDPLAQRKRVPGRDVQGSEDERGDDEAQRSRAVTARTKNAGIPTIAARFARGMVCRFNAGVLSRTACIPGATTRPPESARRAGPRAGRRGSGSGSEDDRLGPVGPRCMPGEAVVEVLDRGRSRARRERRPAGFRCRRAPRP